MINDAQAQAATASTGGFDPMSLLPLLLIGVVFYFFLIRPQQKKAAQQKSLLSALRRGDRVITSGGIFGFITKILNEQEVQVEIAEGVRVRVARSMIADVLSNSESIANSQDDSEETETRKSPAPKSAVKKAAGRSKK
jgi:preprotein translocase subunit YajC